MAVPIAKVRGRIRARLNDTDGRLDAPSGPQIDMAIAEAWILLAGQLPAPVLVVPSGVTIAALSDTFSLPVTVASSGYGTGTTEYGGDVRLQIVSSGQNLRKITNVEMDALHSGAPIIPYSIPRDFALYQDNAQIVRGRCWPGANLAQACNLWATISPEDLRDYVGTGGAEGMDTVTVPGTREAVQSLVAYTASCLLKKMDAKAVALRGINPAVAEDWQRESDRLLDIAEIKQHNVKSTGRIIRFTP